MLKHKLRIACHSALRLVGQEPQPSQATDMALTCCFPGEGCNYGLEYCPVNLAQMTTSMPFWDLLHTANYDM